jgi:hypothetical protein
MRAEAAVERVVQRAHEPPGPARCRSRWTRAACARAASRAAPRRRAMRRRSSALGHRLDRRAPGCRAGTACPPTRIGHQHRVARREGEERWTRACAAPRPASTRTASSMLVVDERVHRHHVVEAAQRRVEHVAAAQLDARRSTRRRPAQRRARARAPPACGDRSMATTCGAAPRRLHRQRAGAAAGVEHARAVQVVRQPVEQGRAHAVAAGAHGGADAAHGRGRRSAAPRRSTAVRSK